MAFHAGCGYAEHLRALLDREAREEAQLDDAGLLRIERGETVQRVVERDDVETAIWPQFQRIVESQTLGVATALGAVSGARMVHEDLPHEVGRNTEKMRTVLPWSAFGADEAEIRLVDERRALQGVAGTLASQKALRETVQLAIDERHEAIQRVRVTGFRPNQEFGDRSLRFTRHAVGPAPTRFFAGDRLFLMLIAGSPAEVKRFARLSAATVFSGNFLFGG